MNIAFTKMEGCGNDYIYIDGAAYPVSPDEKPEFVRRFSDRHFGIGSDGVIFINPSEIADFEMEMWNADGTRSQMCGNGIRCVARFVYDHGMTDKTEMTIESFGAVKIISMDVIDGEVRRVRVDMGEPVLEAKKIPVQSDHERVVDEPVFVGGREYRMTCVSMGNPHAVIFEDPDSVDLERIGPLFEHHDRFPERTNTEFVKILDPSHVKMRVWERGTGETLCCGTGCCATAVACILNGLTEDKVAVKTIGGEVVIEWNRTSNRVIMTGPATTVFEGTIQW